MRPQAAELPVVVVGAGAAGLMAAIFAASGPRPVLLLEGDRASRPEDPDQRRGTLQCPAFAAVRLPTSSATGRPTSCAKILRAWPLPDVRRFFDEDLAVPLRLEAETGKLFPESDRARNVLDALAHCSSPARRAAAAGGAHDRPGPGRYLAGATGRGRYDCRRPGDPRHRWSLGAGDRQRRRRPERSAALGHVMVDTYPALVPLTGSNPAHHALAGLSLPVTLTAHIARRQTRLRDPRRPALHASRLQRPGCAQHLTRRRPFHVRRRAAPSHLGLLDGTGCERLGCQAARRAGPSAARAARSFCLNAWASSCWRKRACCGRMLRSSSAKSAGVWSICSRIIRCPGPATRVTGWLR